jgi:hypothetical protein
MAIVKVNYCKAPKAARAKATIRYMQHRPGKDGAKITRVLFGSDGRMERIEAYQMIDAAEEGSTLFRIVLNFDPKTEDTFRDLSLRDVTEQVMRALEDQLHKPVSWVAAVHDDHTPLRHVHALAIVKEKILPVVAMRQTATQVCLEQRRERDHARELREHEQEGGEWALAE